MQRGHGARQWAQKEEPTRSRFCFWGWEIPTILPFLSRCPCPHLKPHNLGPRLPEVQGSFSFQVSKRSTESRACPRDPVGPTGHANRRRVESVIGVAESVSSEVGLRLQSWYPRKKRAKGNSIPFLHHSEEFFEKGRGTQSHEESLFRLNNSGKKTQSKASKA